MPRSIKRRKSHPRKKLKYARTYSGRGYRLVPTRQIKRRKGSYKKTNNKLTRRTKQILFEALSIGMSRKSACALAGISDKTFAQHMDYGKDPTLTKYYHFRQKIKKLEAKRQKEALEVIRACGNGGLTIRKTKIKNSEKGGLETETQKIELAPQWQAAAWYLERKDKTNWGRDSIGETKTPNEIAQEVMEAQQALFSSVPLQPTNEGDD